MAQTLRFTWLGVGDAAERGGDHVAVLEGGGKLRALVRIVAEPVQQLGKAPLVRIDAAAPLDGFEILLVGEGGDLLRFGFGAMIAPQVVVAERLHVRVDGHDAGAGGVEGDGLDRHRRGCRRCGRPRGVAAARAAIWSACACVA